MSSLEPTPGTGPLAPPGPAPAQETPAPQAVPAPQVGPSAPRPANSASGPRRRPSVGEAFAQLSRAQKPKRGVSLYSRFINRPMGRAFAAVAAAVGLSANAVTLISTLVTMAGLAVVALVEPSPAQGVLVALLLVLGFGLDSADGQVARLSERSSPFGEWFDHVVDCVKMVLLHTAVLVSFYRFSTDVGWKLLLPLAWQVLAVTVFFAGILTDQILRRATADGRLPERQPSMLRAIILLPGDYGILCLSFALFGSFTAFLPVYGVLFLLNLGIGGALFVRWGRQMAAGG